MTITREINGTEITIELTDAELRKAWKELELRNYEKLFIMHWYFNHDGKYPFTGEYHKKLVETCLHRNQAVNKHESFSDIAEEIISIGLRELPLAKYMPEGCLPLAIRDLY